MSKSSKHIDQLYQEQLGNYTEMPPASVWESLELRLDEEDDKGGGFGDSGDGNGRPRFPLRWWWALLGLLLLVGTAVGIAQLVGSSTQEQTSVTVAPTSNPTATGNTGTAAIDNNTGNTPNASQDPAPTSPATSTSADNNDATTSSSPTTLAATSSTQQAPITGQTPSVVQQTKSEQIETVGTAKTPKSSPANAATTTAIENTTAAPVKAPATTATTIDNDNAPVSEQEPQQTTAEETTTQEQETTEEVATITEEVEEKATAEKNKETTQEAAVVKEQEEAPAETTKTTATKQTTTQETVEEQQEETTQEQETATVATAEKQETHEPEVAIEEKVEQEKEESTTTTATEATTTVTKEEIASQETAAEVEETPEITTEEVEAVEETTQAANKNATTTTTETPASTSSNEEDNPLAVAPEEEMEETTESNNELAYLSKNKKQRKKERKRKANKTQEEETEEDNLGINEFNTLTPTPPKPRKWEIGVKAGYEYGFNNSAKADKFVFSPYLQYMVVPHVSLLFQPTYLLGNAKLTSIQPSESYHNVVSTGLDSSNVIFKGGDSTNIIPDTLVSTYVYNKVYDSTHISYQLQQKQLWNIELPLLLQYELSPNFTVFGGVSLNFSKVLTIQQNRVDFTGLTLSDTVITRQVYPAASPPPPAPQPQNPASYFASNGKPINQLQPYNAQTRNSFSRIGFILGMRYTFAERYMIDLLYQQSAVDKTVITDPELQKVYSQPYMRITLGYKIFK